MTEHLYEDFSESQLLEMERELRSFRKSKLQEKSLLARNHPDQLILDKHLAEIDAAIQEVKDEPQRRKIKLQQDQEPTQLAREPASPTPVQLSDQPTPDFYQVPTEAMETYLLGQELLDRIEQWRINDVPGLPDRALQGMFTTYALTLDSAVRNGDVREQQEMYLRAAVVLEQLQLRGVNPVAS